MLIPGRAALFMIVTLALGPGVLANGILKEHSARMRPEDVVQLGGSERFTPWWDPRGPCQENCSFIAGEPSGAFWTLAPAALTPPPWRALAYAGALAFHGLIYRWRPTRLSDAMVERPLERIGKAVRDALGACGRLFRRGAAKRS
jgi:lipid A 4'-phosphatase